MGEEEFKSGAKSVAEQEREAREAAKQPGYGIGAVNAGDPAEDPTTPASVNEQGDKIQDPTPDLGPAPGLEPDAGDRAAAEAQGFDQADDDGPDRRPYEERTVQELRDLAASRGVATSGSKDELIERLRG
jgi:SAP domain